MSETNWYVDYDPIARTYDKRYERNQYAEVEQALLQFVGNQRRLQILEVGCGTGHWLERLHAYGYDITGLDFSAQMLHRAQTLLSDVTLIRGRAERLPFPPTEFDRVFCINALHHFTDKPVFLTEVKRILRPNGKMLNVGLDPHTGLDQWYIYDYFPESLEIDRQRFPSSSSLREWMRSAGFKDNLTREVEHWEVRLPAHDIMNQGRLDKAATSQLSVLADTEYQRGMEKLHADIKHAEEKGQTLILTADLRLYETTGSIAK